MSAAADNPDSPAPPLLERARGISHAQAVLLIVLFSTPLLLLFLASADPSDMMELFNLVPVREAYRDGHWFMPTLDGAPRFEKPPLAVWIPAALGSLLHNDSLWILRLPSLLLGVLTSIVTYALGCHLFGNPGEPAARKRFPALLAALFLPAIHLFNHEARLASYDIYATAFTTLCALCILRLVDCAGAARPAQRPLGASRWWTWTSLGGVALGLALLSKGPAPPATVLLPLALWVVIFHRSKALVGALAMIILVSLAAAVPWGLAIALGYPEARVVWMQEAIKLTSGRRGGVGGQVDPALRDPWYYYLQMAIWTVPLSPTFIAGLALPFLPSHSDPAPSPRERQGRWLLWMIVLGGLLLLSLPSEKKLRYSLQLSPFVCLLCAAVWQEFIRLGRKTPVDAPAGVFLWAQALFLIVPGTLGIAAAVWVRAAGGFFSWPPVAEALRNLGLLPALLLGGGLLALGVWHLRLQYRRHFAWAAGTLALGAWLLMMSVQCVIHGMPEVTVNPTRAAVERAVAQVGGAPIYTLHEAHPWIHTLFFANRPLIEAPSQALVDRAVRTPREPLHLMVIAANLGGIPGHDEPAPGVAACLAEIESQSGRTPRLLAEWLDERRHTDLIVVPPAVDAGASRPGGESPAP